MQRRISYGIAVVTAVSSYVYFGWSLGWSLFLGYLCTIADGASTAVGGPNDRSWPSAQKWGIWRPIADLIWGQHSVVCSPQTEKQLADVKQAIVACHPHGVVSFCHAQLFLDCSGYQTRFPNFSGEQRRDLGASVVFLIPFFRDILLWSGCVDAGKATARRILRSGRSLFVYPGGEKEQLLTEEGKHRCYVRTRKGFCRLAVEFGVPVVPHYAFGETAVFGVSQFLFGLRMFLCDKLHVALPLAFGRWGIPFPLGLPKRPPAGMHLCVGAALHPARAIDPKAEKEEFEKAVDELHARYLEALVKLFDENKAACAGSSDPMEVQMEILPREKGA